MPSTERERERERESRAGSGARDCPALDTSLRILSSNPPILVESTTRSAPVNPVNRRSLIGARNSRVHFVIIRPRRAMNVSTRQRAALRRSRVRLAIIMGND